MRDHDRVLPDHGVGERGPGSPSRSFAAHVVRGAPGRVRAAHPEAARRSALDRGPRRVHEHQWLSDRATAPAVCRDGGRRRERDDPGVAQRPGTTPTARFGTGLSLSVIPACVGCKALATCHYFPTFRRYLQRIRLICRPEPPPGEQLRYLARRLVAFVDPPFVKGAGWPSGAGLRLPDSSASGRGKPGGVHLKLYVAGGPAGRLRRQRRRRAQPPRPRSVSGFSRHRLVDRDEERLVREDPESPATISICAPARNLSQRRTG